MSTFTCQLTVTLDTTFHGDSLEPLLLALRQLRGVVDVKNPATASCCDNAPAGFGGHWRVWHRGHACDKDDGRPRSSGAVAEITENMPAESRNLPSRVPSEKALAVSQSEAANVHQMSKALLEACDIFEDVWCPEIGHVPRTGTFSRIKQLRMYAERNSLSAVTEPSVKDSIQ